ncbi:MAG TPA: helix-turn-helix domain-containing protein, partial [Chthoniobacterales bacterium]|nr:helix-turn-helix domain-containing protein [Chthoniobacterales bacterium]
LRELRNVIERAVILCDGVQIGVEDLSDSIKPPSDVRLGGPFDLQTIESEHIRRLVENTPTLDEAARILGVDPATLYRKRKKL